jgi:hypothetical protein
MEKLHELLKAARSDFEAVKASDDPRVIKLNRIDEIRVKLWRDFEEEYSRVSRICERNFRVIDQDEYSGLQKRLETLVIEMDQWQPQ